MAESMPPEGQQPLTREQTRQLRRSLTEKILDKAESDPQWRQLLIDDPELAMREANFPETQRLERRQEEAEVSGQVIGGEWNEMYGRRMSGRCRWVWRGIRGVDDYYYQTHGAEGFPRYG
jgi:hypothetical protein